MPLLRAWTGSPRLEPPRNSASGSVRHFSMTALTYLQLRVDRRLGPPTQFVSPKNRRLPRYYPNKTERSQDWLSQHLRRPYELPLSRGDCRHYCASAPVLAGRGGEDDRKLARSL